MASYIEKLVETHPLRDGLIRSAIRSLGLPAGSRGLDAGCGVGYHTVMLAEEVGPGGHVTGFDLTPEFLDFKLRREEALAAAELRELQAIIDYNIAVANYYRATGTLLDRNGIDFAEQP